MSDEFEYTEPVERESSIEKEAWEHAESKGWFRTKIMRTSKAGFPDHIFVRDGVVIFVEFKRPGENPTPQQKKRMWQLRKHGARVEVIDNMKKARELFR